MRSTMFRRLLPVALAAFACLAPSAALGADFVWSGNAPAGSEGWSSGANWEGGTAPTASASIGTLTFPQLARDACQADPPTSEACFGSHNDLDGISVEHLVLSNGYGPSYQIDGNGFTLGAGGLDAAPPSGLDGGVAFLLAPIALGASQTWSLRTGNVVAQDLTGAAASLNVDVSDDAGLYLEGDNEVGDVIVHSDGSGGSINLYSDDLGTTFKLNATDGHSLTTQDADLLAVNAAIGPLVSVGSSTEVGRPFGVDPGILSVASAAFDTDSDVAFDIAAAGATVGVDYGQLVSSGPIDLGDAELDVLEALPSGQCPALPVGRQYTLISTTGALTGTFRDAPDGGILFDDFCGTAFHVDYHETGPVQTVTATVVPNAVAPANTALPQISGVAAPGSTLDASAGSWSGDVPMTFSYQWLRDGSPIAGAQESLYDVGAADAGHQLAVRVTAQNVAGTASATSAAVVVAGGSGGGSGGAPAAPTPASASTTASVASIHGLHVHGARLVVQVACSQGGGCPRVVARLTAVERLRGGRVVGLAARRRATRTVLIGSATVALTAGSARSLTLQLNRTGRTLLARFGRLPVTLHLSGGRASSARRIVLRAPARTRRATRR